MESKNNKIVFLRHGESQWNKENRFTGWTDVNLTEIGEKEAVKAGILLKKELFQFDLVFSSVLKRAIDTMKICLSTMNFDDSMPIEYDWRLNERHYGALQGLNKSDTAKKYSEKQVLLWRRSYNTSPPLLDFKDKRHPRFDLKYQHLDADELPIGECLKDTVKRVKPLWENIIVPKILLGKKILIVAHGNSLRSIVKIINNISDQDIINVNIPTGIPFVYELDEKLNPIRNYYLGDHKELQKRLASVINQGKSN